MKFLSKNIRSLILISSFVLSIGIYFFIIFNFTNGDSQIIKLAQTYGLLALFFLYITLLASPLTQALPQMPFRGQYIFARKSLGISAFYFGLLHGGFSFFGELGGFSGLGFLTNQYLFAIIISFLALIILTLLAATSPNFMIVKLGSKHWKMLHRCIYLAGILILIHAFMLGSHFSNFSEPIPQLFFVAMVFLLTLEALRIDRYLCTKYPTMPKFGSALLIVMVGLSIMGVLTFIPTNTDISFNIHAQHIQLAKEAQSSTNFTDKFSNIPGLSGDKTRRFTVSFLHPKTINPNQLTELRFEVFDANNGNQIIAFQKIYEKLLHLIIVDSQLNTFEHIHPEFDGKDFVIKFQFLKAGTYHLYLNFQPLGAIEQQFGFTVDVGQIQTNQNKETPLSSHLPDQNFTKNFGPYQVTLITPQPLKASLMAIGEQRINFSLLNAKTNQPVTNLKPYLGAFGHLVMINKETYDFIHIHPANMYAPAANAKGGPDVEFLPLGLYGPIKPGIYRIFAQFNADGNLMVADYTVKIDE